MTLGHKIPTIIYCMKVEKRLGKGEKKINISQVKHKNGMLNEIYTNLSQKLSAVVKDGGFWTSNATAHSLSVQWQTFGIAPIREEYKLWLCKSFLVPTFHFLLAVELTKTTFKASEVCSEMCRSTYSTAIPRECSNSYHAVYIQCMCMHIIYSHRHIIQYIMEDPFSLSTSTYYVSSTVNIRVSHLTTWNIYKLSFICSKIHLPYYLKQE